MSLTEPNPAFQRFMAKRLDCGIDCLFRVSDSVDREWINPVNVMWSLSMMGKAANHCEAISRQLLIARSLFSGLTVQEATEKLHVQRRHTAEEIAAIDAIQKHVKAWQSRN